MIEDRRPQQDADHLQNEGGIGQDGRGQEIVERHSDEEPQGALPVFGVTRTPVCRGKSEQRRTADPPYQWCLSSDLLCLKQQKEEDRRRHDKPQSRRTFCDRKQGQKRASVSCVHGAESPGPVNVTFGTGRLDDGALCAGPLAPRSRLKFRLQAAQLAVEGEWCLVVVIVDTGSA
ncbi:hypothetical protein FE844_005015 [Rhizobium indicum]|uniref:hypothetical protein n=1 Tax=Rhizobium TaxID=379 RepID=UPI001492F2A1|nr:MULTISPECIES: hypothetical protein [Rhizobium]QKK28973.1 hypothetical protein FE844_005015 [Rhizobium indicum]